MEAETGTRVANLERALQMARIGYFSCDMTDGTYDASPEVKRLYNLPADRTPTRDDILSAVHPGDHDMLELTLMDVLARPRDYQISYRVIGADGSTRRVVVTAVVKTESDGHIHAFGTVQDLTATDQAESFARLIEDRLRSFADAASDWFWETNKDHCIVFVSQRFEQITGMPVASLLGLSRLQYAKRAEGSYGWTRHIADLEARRPFRDFSFWLYSDALEEQRLVTFSGVPVFDHEGEFAGYRGVGHDSTEEHRSRQRMQFLASHDSLTGLLNRHAFEEKAGASLVGASGEPVYLVLLDLDRFKYVNDNFGHARGDQLLVAVARRLTEWLPPSAHIARLAGDEFAVSLAHAGGSAEIAELLKAALGKLGEPYQLDGALVHAKASIGFTKQWNGDVERALLEADVALYIAKSAGGGHVEYFDQKKKLAAARRTSLERELRAALSRQEFSLVYQPQIGLASGRVVGAEALLRWRSGTAQEVSPMEFVPLAEEIGLMPEIGRWVLEQAIRQQRSWLDGGLTGIVTAVNVSATQFVHDDICALLARMLDQTGVPAGDIELEITESVFLQDQELVARAMREVRELGSSIALDDFGTGYSSLSYLRNFPVDRLKIDRSFIQPIIDEPSAAAIVEGIVRLANSLELEIVAEGVEVPDHIDMLKQLGCQLAQGYYFAKPLTPEQFIQFVDQHHRALTQPLDA